MGTYQGGLNRLDYRTGRFKVYTNDQHDSSSLSGNFVTTVFADSRQRIWAGTDRNGLNLLDPVTGRFTRYRHSAGAPASLSGDNISALYEDKDQHIWIGTRGEGLDLLRPDGGFRHFKNDQHNSNSLARDVILSLAGDDKDRLWIGTENGGISILDIHTGIFANYGHDDIETSSLSSNSVYSIFKDAQDNMWVGTYSGGINVHNKNASQFVRYTHSTDPRGLSHNSILNFFEDKDGQVWIATDGGGVNRLDPQKGQFTHFNHQKGSTNSISGNYVLAVQGMPDHSIWMGTCMDGTTVYDKIKKTFKQIKNRPGDHSSISGNNVSAMARDQDQDLWIGIFGDGLNRYDRRTGRFQHFRHDSNNVNTICSDQVASLFADSRGYLWIGTEEKGLDLFDKKTGAFTHFAHTGKTNSLSNNGVNDIFEDSRGRIWICTNAGLDCLDRSTQLFTNYFTRDGLPGNIIFSILEDGNKDFWIATDNGLSRFSHGAKTFTNFSVADGLQPDHFNAHSSLKSRTGMMYFGGVNGFNTFFPDSIRKDSFDPPLVFTHFQVFNKEVPIANGEKDPSALIKDISETKAITLPYDQTVFSFEFASLNYSAREKKQYSYKLEGFDNSWNDIGLKRTSTYTHLDPGKYVFKVRGLKNDGQWSSRITSIEITITPPFWMTWWFRLLAGAAIITAALIVFRLRVGIIKRQKKELEHQVRERTERLTLSMEQEHLARLDAEKAYKEAEEANKAKSIFLATMSHEIRTPMNGVLGMASLLAETALSTQQKEYADTIRSCGEGLMHVINDILDFSKIESGKMELELKSFDLRTCVEEVLDLFSVKAGQEGLDLVYEIDYDVPPTIIGDSLRLRQVLMNLIGNSIKFTHHGEIFVGIRMVKNPKKQDKIEIGFEVRDTGIGIPPEKISRLFNAFSQIDSSTTRKYGGTGLGLVICDKLVNLMGGNIGVESTPGKGTSFSFSIAVTPGVEPVRTFIKNNMAGLKGKKVLVVDDNATNRTVLRDQLGRWKMLVTLAGSGEAALDILSQQPDFDLVITDMQMPGMDGSRFSAIVRNQFPVIPIILLTSIGHDHTKCEADQFNSILIKPVKQSQLCQHILDSFRQRESLTHPGHPDNQKMSAGMALKYPLRLLIAEDNPINQTLIMHILHRLGYDPEAVENGKEALDSVSQQQFDLILMDMQMPEMDGFEATRAIRQRPGNQPVIIALTANAMQGDREECLNAGMNDYLSKPIKQEELIAALKKWALLVPAIPEKE